MTLSSNLNWWVLPDGTAIRCTSHIEDPKHYFWVRRNCPEVVAAEEALGDEACHPYGLAFHFGWVRVAYPFNIQCKSEPTPEALHSLMVVLVHNGRSFYTEAPAKKPSEELVYWELGESSKHPLSGFVTALDFVQHFKGRNFANAMLKGELPPLPAGVEFWPEMWNGTPL